MSALAERLLREHTYEQSRENFEQLVEFLDCTQASSMTHSELERALEKKGRELMRMLLQEHIEARGPGKCEQSVVGADGVERSRIRLQKREIESVFGTIREERLGYAQEAVDSLHPLDAELHLPNERYSLELRRRAAEQAARSSFDETLEMIGKTTGGHVPKRQLEELTIRAAGDFDPFYQRRHGQAVADADSGPILVISADGKGVVMRPEDLREATRKAAEARTHKMGARLSKGEKKNAKRMATVAAVYTMMPFVRRPEELMAGSRFHEDGPARPRPEQKRVWASIEKGPQEVIEEAFQEALYRDPAHEKNWIALVDGNKTQIRILRNMAKKKGLELTIIVDLIHVIEYLWDAARAFHPEAGQELESWVGQRLLEILRGHAGLVAGGMRRSATLRGLTRAQRKAVDGCARYLLTYAPYLKYNRYLAQGLPVATGVIEGACRHLVKDRMDVSGARWSLTGAEAVLRLRALRSSHDFDEYWTFHEAQEYKRNHQSLYAGGIVPPTIAPRQTRSLAHLKVIK